jgi:hypothetical protein
MKILESKMLGGIFERKSEEVRGWRKLHNQELYNLYSSPNIVNIIKSRRMRCMGI